MNKPHTADSCVKMSRAMTGRRHKLGYQTSPETRAMMRASSCPEGRRDFTYQVVRQVFTSMYPRARPIGSATVKQDYMIDDVRVSVRGATLNRAHRWHFTILKNTVPDRFFLSCFDNRTDHNLMHVFCIPGTEINHLVGVSISEKTLQKWADWKIEIDDRKV